MKNFERFSKHIQSLADLNQPEIVKTVNIEINRRQEVTVLRNNTGFNLELHLRANNNGHTSGCGCKFCLSRAKYTSFKLDIHRRKRAFERNNCDYFTVVSEDEINRMVDLHEQEIEYLKERRDNAKQTMDYWCNHLGLNTI
jgi:hypothetical protein